LGVDGFAGFVVDEVDFGHFLRKLRLLGLWSRFMMVSVPAGVSDWRRMSLEMMFEQAVFALEAAFGGG
jgi:hypothetical protein